MLISTSTDVNTNIGSVASNIFLDVAPFVYLIIGLVVAFWIIEYILGVVKSMRSVANFEDMSESQKEEVLDKRWKEIRFQQFKEKIEAPLSSEEKERYEKQIRKQHGVE